MTISSVMRHGRLFKRTLALLLLAAAITLLYNWPRWSAPGAGTFPVVASGDGAFYAWRIQTALKGVDPNLSCAEDASLRGPVTWMPWVEDQLWTSLLRPFCGTDLTRALNLTYAVLPALIFVLLVTMLNALTANFNLSLLVAFAGMTMPGFYFWKPFLPPGRLATLPWFDSLPFFRFANPLLRSVTTIAALGGIFTWLRRIESGSPPGKRMTALTAVLLSLPFYSQVFYWSQLMGTLGLYAALSFARGERKIAGKLMILMSAALALGCPQLIRSLGASSDSLVLESLHRVGLMLKIRQPYFLWHAGILGTFVLYQLIAWKRRDWRWKFCTSTMVCGWLVLNQNLVTGIYNQEHHYFRPLTVIYICVIGDLTARLIERWRRRESAGRYTAPAFAATLAALLLHGAAMSNRVAQGAAAPRELLASANRIPRTLAYLKQVPTAAGLAALVDPDLAYVVGVGSGLSVYVYDYTHQCIIPDDELFDRWALLGRAFGFRSADFARVRDLALPGNLPWWLFGLPATYAGARDRNQVEDRVAMLGAWNLAYDSSKLDDLVAKLRARRGLPGILIESPGFALDRAALEKHFRLEPLISVPEEQTAVWRLISRL